MSCACETSSWSCKDPSATPSQISRALRIYIYFLLSFCGPFPISLKESAMSYISYMHMGHALMFPPFSTNL